MLMKLETFLLVLLLAGCASTTNLPERALPLEGVISDSADTDTLIVEGNHRDAAATSASEARAFLDEATSLLESAESNFQSGDYQSAEFDVREAFQVLLEADILVPPRTYLEMEEPETEFFMIRHVAMLSLREEFEELWNDANALHDRLLPLMNISVFAPNTFEGDEEVDLSAMNAALEAAAEPTPGSWQEIRDLLLEMRREELIDIDMGLEDYRDIAWKRIYWSVTYYRGRGRKNFLTWLERSGRYQKLVEDILVKEGLPRDMVYLCMIESGFSPRAYSRASAVGPWQFMSYTAGKYDLKTSRTDPILDERRDFAKSTVAAAGYLKDLYAEFGSWPLAMAAYNSGEGRVRGAQRWARQYKKGLDYWSIYQRLPRETANYVPYYLAALVIAKNPGRFGFTDIAYQTPFEESYEIVHIDGAMLMEYAAKLAGVPESMLVELNPELHRRMSPKEGYELRIPKGTTDKFISALELIPEKGRVSYLTHTIRRGETGSEIAEKYSLPWSEIRAENRQKIRSDRNLQVGVELRIPQYERSRYLTDREIESRKRQSVVVVSGTPSYHTVRRGDTISGIATRFGVTWMQIRQWNGIRGDIIYPGQRLKLYPGNIRRSTPAVSSAQLPSNGIYTIGKNDTLWDIAQRFRVSVSDLKKWNGLRSNTIYPGRKLIVTREAAQQAGLGGKGDRIPEPSGI